jgi:D-sedoheptulose 7-phosphate isomerase
MDLMASEIIDIYEIEILKTIKLLETLLNQNDIKKNLQKLSRFCINSLSNNGKILLAGNGGSAADCQHIAAEFVSRLKFDRGPLAAIAITTDTSILTAIGNDYGYEKVFDRQLRALARKEDTVILFTTSGKSKNILEALSATKEIGCNYFIFTGNKGILNEDISNQIIIPSDDTAKIQEAHIVIGHILCGFIETHFFQK